MQDRYKRMLSVAITMGVIGGVTGLGMKTIYQMPNFSGEWLPNKGELIPYVGMIGAVISGACTAQAFGREGRAGWGWAAFGAVLATLLGAAIAGTILWPGLGTLTGPMSVATYLAQFPPLLFLWGALMAGLHLGAQRWFPHGAKFS